MRITYDKSVDVAYIYFVNKVEDGAVTDTYSLDEEFDLNGMVNLDVSNSGTLIGLEVLNAKNQLSKELLDKAEIIG